MSTVCRHPLFMCEPFSHSFIQSLCTMPSISVVGCISSFPLSSPSVPFPLSLLTNEATAWLWAAEHPGHDSWELSQSVTPPFSFLLSLTPSLPAVSQIHRPDGISITHLGLSLSLSLRSLKILVFLISRGSQKDYYWWGWEIQLSWFTTPLITFKYTVCHFKGEVHPKIWVCLMFIHL